MDAQKYLIKYGCNSFIFEGSLLELVEIIRTLEKLTPVIFHGSENTYEETGLKKRLRIYSAKYLPMANANYPSYSIDA